MKPEEVNDQETYKHFEEYVYQCAGTVLFFISYAIIVIAVFAIVFAVGVSSDYTFYAIDHSTSDLTV